MGNPRFDWLDDNERQRRARLVRGKVRTEDLLAMSPQNDPFAVNQGARVDSALWFQDLWREFGKHGMHLRRLHYAIVSASRPVLMPTGKPYENTDASWKLLGTGFTNARYLDFVDAAAFVERRSGEARVYASARSEPEPWIEALFADVRGSLPYLDDPVELTIAAPSVEGYDYSNADQGGCPSSC